MFPIQPSHIFSFLKAQLRLNTFHCLTVQGVDKTGTKEHHCRYFESVFLARDRNKIEGNIAHSLDNRTNPSLVLVFPSKFVFSASNSS